MKTRIVVGSALVSSLAVPRHYSQRAEVLMSLWEKSLPRLYAPIQLEYDLSSGLRQACAEKLLTADQGAEALKLLLNLAIESIAPTPELHARAFEWALRLEGEDAPYGHYLSLAESLHAEFWSVNLRMIRLVRQMGAHWAHCLQGNED